MTGIERLREWADGYAELGKDHTTINVVPSGMATLFSDIADQIEREQGRRVSRMRVLSVVTEMGRHVSGVEGMEDSPVARWARELREALGGDGRDPAADVSTSAYDLLPEEDRDAIAWVRKHGGLERVKAQRLESMPRAAYERKKAGFLDHIAECEAALGRRREIISELNHRACDLTRENAELRKRAMPEGCEWPVFEDGEPVRVGDEVDFGGEGGAASSVELQDDGYFVIHACDGAGDYSHRSFRPGERVKRSAKVAASTSPTGAAGGLQLLPSQLTHERPVADTWERLEKDAKAAACVYFGASVKDCENCDHNSWECSYDKARDLVRRARALAERGL